MGNLEFDFRILYEGEGFKVVQDNHAPNNLDTPSNGGMQYIITDNGGIVPRYNYAGKIAAVEPLDDIEPPKPGKPYNPPHIRPDGPTPGEGGYKLRLEYDASLETATVFVDAGSSKKYANITMDDSATIIISKEIYDDFGLDEDSVASMFEGTIIDLGETDVLIAGKLKTTTDQLETISGNKLPAGSIGIVFNMEASHPGVLADPDENKTWDIYMNS